MKALLLNISALLVWVIIGHFSPSISLFSTFIFFPAVFILTALYIKYSISAYVIVPFCFTLIYLNDYLFRIYGGGIHDDAGRAWCELTFYITLFTTTISMFFVMYATLKLGKIGFAEILKIGSYVVILSILTLLIFRKTSVNL